MTEFAREYFLFNEKLIPTIDFNRFFTKPGKYIYEVFRVQEGVPVFIEDHLNRLWKTAQLEQVPLPFSQNELLGHIIRLIQSNAPGDGNIKIFIHRPIHGSLLWFVYFTPHQYPTPEQFRQGVPVRLFCGERENPNAKVMDVALRTVTDEIKSIEEVYEVLLIDHEGYITEGSRSNVFFIKNDGLITPPVETVLEGVTRKHLLNICNENHIPVSEQKVHQSQLHEMEAVFISGTSRRVLPVCCVDELQFKTNHRLLELLYRLLTQRVEEYIITTKNGI